MIDEFKIWRFGSRVRQMRFRSSASYENILCKVYEICNNFRNNRNFLENTFAFASSAFMA